MSSIELAWVESGLPGGSSRARFGLANDLGISVELVNDGGLEARLDAAASTLPVRCASVQAYRLHQWSPTSPSPDRRRRAVRHIFETIELARALKARTVVTVADYCAPSAAETGGCRGEERFADRAFAEIQAREFDGVTVLIEPLSPKRSPIYQTPESIWRLLRDLRDPRFALLIDVRHLLDGLAGNDGQELFRCLEEWLPRADSLHLGSYRRVLPGELSLPRLADLVSSCPSLRTISVEPRFDTTVAEVTETVAALRDLFG